MPKNKIRFPKSSLKIPPIVARVLFICVALALLVLAIAGYAWKVMCTSSQFTIQDIIARKEGINLAYLKGRNIFAVDLRREARFLAAQYPDYKRVKLIRVLPDRLYVDFIVRQPLALIKLYRWFAVDDEATLFFPASDVQEAVLPVITGLETKIYGPKSGRRYELRELAMALEIIKEAGASRVLKNYRLSKIDVSSIANTSVFISLPLSMPGYAPDPQRILYDLLEVKIGYGNIKQKMLILEGVVAQSSNDLSRIKYIDLRFKEPVIKLKDAK